MKKNCLYMTLIALLSLCLTTSCSKDDDEKAIEVNFTSLVADGSATETTTVLTLTFDKEIAGLTAENITLTPGTTGTTKGTLTAKGAGVYELAVSGITAAGEVTVAVSKEGFTLTPVSKSATVSLYEPTITDKALIAAIEAAAKVTFVKEADGSVSVTANKTVIQGITELNLSSKGLTHLEGIKYLTELTTLYCSSNGFTTLDVSKLTKLTTFYCQLNAKLATLSLPLVNTLTELNCSRCALTTLNISGLTKLNRFFCNANRLTELDLSALKIDILSDYTMLSCGTHTSDGKTAQEIKVTVTQAQLDQLSDRFDCMGDNSRIKWIVK